MAGLLMSHLMFSSTRARTIIRIIRETTALASASTWTGKLGLQMNSWPLNTVIIRNLFSGLVDPNTTKDNEIPDAPIFRYFTPDVFSNMATFQASLRLQSQNATKLGVSLINYPFDK